MAMSPEEKRARHAANQRAWIARNQERWQEIARKARSKWKENNRDEHRECQRSHRYFVRREILDLLGGQKCVHCGYEKDWRALQVDHIAGGGKRDVRTSGGNTNLWSFRLWIIANKSEALATYQVLCANCNWIKRHEGGEQPNGKVLIGD